MNLSHYKKPSILKKIIKLQLFFKTKLKLLCNMRMELYKLSHLTQSINKNINPFE